LVPRNYRIRKLFTLKKKKIGRRRRSMTHPYFQRSGKRERGEGEFSQCQTNNQTDVDGWGIYCVRRRRRGKMVSVQSLQYKARDHTHKHTHAYAHAHKRIHTRTHTRTHTHTHTHKHTHKRARTHTLFVI